MKTRRKFWNFDSLQSLVHCLWVFLFFFFWGGWCFCCCFLYDFLYHLILSMSRIFFSSWPQSLAHQGISYCYFVCFSFPLYGNKWATCLLIIRYHYNYFKNHNIDIENFTQNTSFNESKYISIPSDYGSVKIIIRNSYFF